MGKIGDLWVHLGLKKQGFDQGLNDAKKKSKSSADGIVANFKKIAVQVTAAIAAIKGFASAFKVIADFERANSTLAAVLGTTKKGVEGLAQSARDLGKSTEYTASEVTGLQIELARLGFNENQIKEMQADILDFALAVGTDLSSAAARAGATMRGFGLTAKETGEVLSTMAVSTSKSALSFNYLDSSLGKFVPVAKNAGMSIKDSVALLGTLANRGIDASSASTGLKNVLLSMGTSSGKAAKALGGPVKSFDELIAGMQRLKSQGADFANLFGKYSYSVALALADGADAAKGLRGELENTDGALKQMAGTMGDNVEGSIKKLASAWQEFILSLSASKGVIKWAIDELTKLVGVITTITTGKSFKSQGIDKLIESKVEETKGWTDAQFSGAIGSLKDRRLAAKGIGGSKGRSMVKDIDKQIYVLEQAQERIKDMSAETAEVMQNFGIPEGGEESNPLEELLKKIGKTDPLKQLKEEARELAQEATEVNRADEELADGWDGLLDKFEKAKGLIKDVSDVQDVFVKASMDAAEALYQEQLAAEAVEYAMSELQSMEDEAKEMAEALKIAIVEGLSDGLNELTDQLMGLEDFNMGGVMKALLTPLADMAQREGELLVYQGLGIEALKTSLATLQGPAAIAAGTALIGIAAAAKSGMKALAQTKGSSSAGTASAAASGSSATNTKYEDMNITVNIEGKVKGSDIILAAQKTQSNWAR